MLIIVGLSWYTFSLYRTLYSNFSVDKQHLALPTRSVNDNNQAEGVVVEKGASDSDKGGVVENMLKSVEDPDNLINGEVLKKAEQEWAAKSGPQPSVTNRKPCSMYKCGENEFDFKVISGAANVIGPSICFNNTILMKNSLNNINRGMNVAQVDGQTGKLQRHASFDLYSKDSSELKEFLKDMSNTQIVLIASYDDSASRLDEHAREMLRELGSKHSKELAFRDNWIFVGGQTLAKPYEGIMKNKKETNKYGDWPAAITIEGCVPKS